MDFNDCRYRLTYGSSVHFIEKEEEGELIKIRIQEVSMELALAISDKVKIRSRTLLEPGKSPLSQKLDNLVNLNYIEFQN